MQRRMVLVLSVAALFALNVGASNGTATHFPNRAAAQGADSGSFKIESQLSGAGWTINSPIPEPLGVAQGSAVASADGSRIYYIGGITGALVATNKVRVYFPEYDVWFDAADTPVSPGIRTFGSAVELNGFIYVFGGFDGTNVLDTTWIYDESKNVWFQGTNMPGPRFGSAVAADGTIIWVLGGAQGLSLEDAESDRVWRYDPGDDSWLDYTYTPIRLGRSRGAILPNGDLHFLGGEFDGNIQCGFNFRVHIYFCRTPIPFGITDAAVATDGVRIYVAGGGGPAPRTAGRTQIFDTISRNWSLGPAMPSGVDNTSGAIANGTLYVMGGYDGTSPVSVNYSLPLSSLEAEEIASMGRMNPDPVEALHNREPSVDSRHAAPSPWSFKWPVPEAYGVAQGSTVASKDDSLIYHIGGYTGLITSNRLRVYSPADDTGDASSMRSPWWDAAPVPEAYGIRSYGSAVELNGFIYVFGGASATVLNTTWIYNEANDVWLHGANMPGYRFGPAVATDGAVIWVIGGYNQVGPDHTVWLYDPRADGYVTGFRDMPIDLGRIHGVWLPDGTIHVLGGNSPSLGSHLVYDTVANTWFSAPPMPIPVLDPAVVTDGTLIYLAGASNFPRGPAHTQIFDPASGTWSEGPLLPPWPRLGDWGVDNTSGTIANDVFYVMGGFTSGSVFFNYSIPLSKLRVLNR